MWYPLIGFAATLALGLSGSATKEEYLGEVVIDPGTLKKLKRAPKARLVYNRKIKPDELSSFHTPKEAYETVRSIFKPEIDVREMVVVLFLNHRNHPIAYFELSKGGISKTTVDLRILMAAALSCLAVKMVLVHNHPTGILTPSLADISLTKRLFEAGNLMGIQLLEHLIVTQEGFYSFVQANQFPFNHQPGNTPF